MAPRRISERRIVDVLVHFLRQEHLVCREFSHYERRIDVALVHSECNEVWAIEAKTVNWARALSQALVNTVAADQSYIAIYEKYAHRVPTERLESMGIGLISVGSKWGEVKILKEARRSVLANRLAVDRIRSSLSQGLISWK